MNQLSKSKKIATAGVLVAIGVVCSGFYIPIGVAKCFPAQHMINVIAGIMLGPGYAVCMAFSTSFIRIMMGTGSLLAFPGSMCGALLCAVLYKKYQMMSIAFIGEIVGTGILGALLSWPVAVFLLGKEVAVFGFVLPFGISTIVGAGFGILVIHGLSKTGIFHHGMNEGGVKRDV